MASYRMSVKKNPFQDKNTREKERKRKALQRKLQKSTKHKSNVNDTTHSIPTQFNSNILHNIPNISNDIDTEKL